MVKVIDFRVFFFTIKIKKESHLKLSISKFKCPSLCLQGQVKVNKVAVNKFEAKNLRNGQFHCIIHLHFEICAEFK